MNSNTFNEIPDNFLKKWQEIADLIAAIISIPAALIMKIEDDFMEVFISSKTENNPYKPGNKEHWQGLYCETVIKTQEKLLITNALKDVDWDKNPDIKLGMIAYLGIPLNFPNNQPFGTLCVLDTKETQFTTEHEKLLNQFKNVIELDLALIQSLDLNENIDNKEIIQKLINQYDEYIAINEELTQTNDQLYNEKEKVSESEKHFRLLVESSPYAIFIQTEGKFSYINKTAIKLYGADSEMQLLNTFVLDRIHPDFRDIVKQRIKALNEDKWPVSDIQYKHLKIDNTPVDVEVSAVPFKFQNFDGALVFVNDISEKKKLNQQVIEKEQNLDNIFTNSPAGIFVIDINKKGNYFINSVNPAHENLTGLKNENVKGQPLEILSELFGKEVYKYVKTLYDKIVASKEILSFEEEMMLNNKLVQVNTTIKPLVNENGNVYRLIGTNLDISKLKETERKLIEAKDIADRNQIELKKAQEITHIGSWFLDIQTNEVVWTEELYRMYNFDPTQPVPPYTEHSKLFTPESWEILSASLAKTRQTGIPYELELKTIKKDGTNGWMWVRGEVVKDENEKAIGLWGAAQDITERKKTEEDLKKAKEKAEENHTALLHSHILMQYIIEHSHSAVAVHDKDLRYLYVSKKYLADFKVKEKNIIGKHHYEVFPDLPQKWRDIHQKALQGYVSSADDDPYHKDDGTTEWTRWECRPWYEVNGEIGGFIIYTEVITERKEFELELLKAKEQSEESERLVKEKNEEYEALNEELREANDDLIIAKEKAEEGNRLKISFLQNMSHEIRTPLNSIIGFSEILNSPKITEDKRQFYTDIIIKSGFQLLSIVSDILTISSIDTGQEQLNLEHFILNSVISEIETVFKKQLDGKQIKIKTKISLSDASSGIFNDKTKLTQILTNLLSNAVKFTPYGEIEFGYTLMNGELEFFVKDNGIGIDKKNHTSIFDRFAQADDKIHVNYGGTGLGLSICRGFVELLGGRIWVESALGKGASFYFTIPYKYKKNEKERNEKYFENKIVSNNNDNLTILVAEDQFFNFVYIEELLKDLKINVLHAKNGEEAVDICKNNESIDIVLMDIKMPIMDGYTASLIIKKIRPDLKIIAQTAYATSKEIEKYEKAFDNYLTKPLTSEKLTNGLSKYLKQSK